MKVCQIIRGTTPQPPPTLPPSVAPDIECQNSGESGDTWWAINQVNNYLYSETKVLQKINKHRSMSLQIDSLIVKRQGLHPNGYTF